MLSIAVNTILPEESNNEIANFREKIQECVEQELRKIENVEIVDLEKREWNYYMEITFDRTYPIEENSSTLLVKINAHFRSSSITEMGIYYNCLDSYTIDRIPIACELLVEEFMIEVQNRNNR